jgi:curved DNA-binding protein CbpA
MEGLEIIGAIAETGAAAGVGIVGGGAEAVGAGLEGLADAGAGAGAGTVEAGAELLPNPLENLGADGIPLEPSPEAMPEQENVHDEKFGDNVGKESRNTEGKSGFDQKTESSDNSENNGDLKSDWETLGVSENATPEEIRDAYRELAKETHPDVNGNAGDAEKFRNINEAFERLRSGQPRTREQATDIREAYQERVRTAQENSRHYADADTAKKDAGTREDNKANQGWTRKEQPKSEANQEAGNYAKKEFDERAREGRQETRNRRERGPRTSENRNEGRRAEQERKDEEEIDKVREKLYGKQSGQKEKVASPEAVSEDELRRNFNKYGEWFSDKMISEAANYAMYGPEQLKNYIDSLRDSDELAETGKQLTSPEKLIKTEPVAKAIETGLERLINDRSLNVYDNSKWLEPIASYLNGYQDIFGLNKRDILESQGGFLKAVIAEKIIDSSMKPGGFFKGIVQRFSASWLRSWL